MLAPRNAADPSESPPEAGAQAASVVAARAATWRRRAPAGSARTDGKSWPARTARDQRRSEAHPAAAVAPTILNGLTRFRITAAGWPPQPQSASASAIAPAA